MWLEALELIRSCGDGKLIHQVMDRGSHHSRWCLTWIRRLMITLVRVSNFGIIFIYLGITIQIRGCTGHIYSEDIASFIRLDWDGWLSVGSGAVWVQRMLCGEIQHNHQHLGAYGVYWLATWLQHWLPPMPCGRTGWIYLCYWYGTNVCTHWVNLKQKYYYMSLFLLSTEDDFLCVFLHPRCQRQ